MTVATGGEVVELVVDRMQGGHVLSRGGNRFLTLTAGYLGSLLWGSVIYLLAVKSTWDKLVMFALGTIILLVCVLFVRDLFAMAFGLGAAGAMLLLGVKAPMAVNDVVLRVIGTTSMLYAPLDIYSDTIQRAGLRSDAVMLAEHFGGTGLLWGGIWLLISIVIIVATHTVGLRTSPPAVPTND